MEGVEEKNELRDCVEREIEWRECSRKNPCKKRETARIEEKRSTRGERNWCEGKKEEDKEKE